jgi:hypothetical protein
MEFIANKCPAIQILDQYIIAEYNNMTTNMLRRPDHHNSATKQV